jgi:hypothetical protein
MDVRFAERDSPMSMMFVVERMDLTGPDGTFEWQRAATRHCGETLGPDAHGVLAAVVAGDGGVQLGVAARYADGQAVMLARKGRVVYALRARPHARVGASNEN